MGSERPTTDRVRATVREWRETEGWGVLDARELGGEGIWAHFSAIDKEGFKTLRTGQVVGARVEGPLPFDQDGHRYRATHVWP